MKIHYTCIVYTNLDDGLESLDLVEENFEVDRVDSRDLE